ncbi:MAG: winged helix-turn-helix domain-containing protein [Solirubrobacterales bacterium]
MNFLEIEPTPKVLPSPFSPPGEVDASYVWGSLAPRLLHPLKLVTLEALLWVGEPMSATGLAAMLDDPDHYAGLLSYHLAVMAEAGVVSVVGRRPARGAVELFYYFPSREKKGDRSAGAGAKR